MAAAPDAAPKMMTAAVRPAPALVGMEVVGGAWAAAPEACKALVTPHQTAAPPAVVATSPLASRSPGRGQPVGPTPCLGEAGDEIQLSSQGSTSPC